MQSAYERRVARLRQHVLGKGGAETLPSAAEILSRLTVPQLKEQAKDAGIEGFNNMNKAALIESLLEFGVGVAEE